MKKGFTLIELLIVIAIIGVLAVALLPTITGGPSKARDAARTTALNNIATVLENYNLDKGKYPDNGAGEANCLNDAADPGAGLSAYFKQGVPTDQSSEHEIKPGDGVTCTGSYYYKKLTGGGYALITSMENANSNNAKVAEGHADWTYAAVQVLIDKDAEDNTHYIVVSK